MPPRAKKSTRKKIGHKKGGRLAKHQKSKHTKKGRGVDWTKLGTAYPQVEGPANPNWVKRQAAANKGRFGRGIADLHRKAVEFLNSEKGKDILGKAAGFAKKHAPKVVTAAKDYRAKYGRPPK